jgi:hypothetical protein
MRALLAVDRSPMHQLYVGFHTKIERPKGWCFALTMRRRSIRKDGYLIP